MYPHIDGQSKWWTPVSCTVALALAALLGGCGAKQKVQQPVVNETPTVRIDRADNGAAAAPAAGRFVAAQAPRMFAFEMTGVGKAGRADASSEDRAAAGQAAIIEAFCNALIEARGKKPDSAPSFEVDFGPRLKVARTDSSDGVRTTVTLVSRGIETKFVSVAGKLQHQPHDLRLVQQVFDATNGEFSLLASSWSPGTGQSVATVARYLPAELDSALAGGDAAGKSTDGMAPTAATP